MKIIVFYFAFFAACISTHSNASSCNAHNDNGDTCSIDCPVGESAQCTNATGSSTPTCECSSSLHKSKLTPQDVSLKEGEDKNQPAIQSTNAADVLNKVLSEQRDVNLRNTCVKVETGEQICRTIKQPCFMPGKIETQGIPEHNFMCRDTICYPVLKDSCSVVKGKVSVVGLVSVVGDATVKVEDPNWKGIPVQHIGRRLTYLNCSDIEQSQQFNITQEITIGSRILMTKSIENTTQTSFKLGFSYAISGDVSTSFSRKVSFSNQEEQAYAEKKTYQESYPVKVAPNSFTTFEVSWSRIEVPIRFTGTAIVDASVTPNLEGIISASQLITKPEDRTIEFEGIVYDSNVFGASTKNLTRAATAADCAGKGGALETLSETTIN